MRQIFTSPRLENVEKVAQMLRAEQIEVKISNGRSYKGNRRSQFSYREQERTGSQPTVWIINPDDQPRARELLREAGLLESTRTQERSSYLPTPTQQSDAQTSKFPIASRIRIGLMVALGILVILNIARRL